MLGLLVSLEIVQVLLDQAVDLLCISFDGFVLCFMLRLTVLKL